MRGSAKSTLLLLAAVVLSLAAATTSEAAFNASLWTLSTTSWDSCTDSQLSFPGGDNDWTGLVECNLVPVSGVEASLSLFTPRPFDTADQTQPCWEGYTPMFIGVYQVQVVFNDSTTYTNPQTVTVTDSAFAFNNTFLTGQQTVRADLADKNIDIIPVSWCEKPTSCSPEGVNFTFTFDNGDVVPVDNVALQADGLCQYGMPGLTQVGVYNVTIAYNGTVLGMESFVVIPGSASSLYSRAYYQGAQVVTSGSTACVNMSAVDSYNNTLSGLTSSDISALYDPANITTSMGAYTVSSIASGLYQICFVPALDGNFSVHIKIATQNGPQDVQGSPFPITVLPGSFSPSLSLLQDAEYCVPGQPCLSSDHHGLTSTVAGQVAYFDILLRDGFGNIKLTDSDVNITLFSVSLTAGSIVIDANVTARPDTQSALLVSYTAFIVGLYSINATYNGQAIGTGASAVPVYPGNLSVALSSLTYLSENGIQAGGSLYYSVTAVDDYNNTVSFGSGWSAALVGLSNITCDFADDYSITCVPTITGTYVFSVLYQGAPFHPNNAVILVQPTFLSPTLSYFVFSPSVVVAGTSFEITVSSFDTWGNPGGVSSTNNQPVISAALNPTGAGSTISRTDTLTSAVYTVNFSNLTSVGVYNVTVSSGAFELTPPVASLMQIIPAATDAAKCLLTPINATMVAGNVAFFQIVARDQFLNIQDVVNETDLFQINFVPSTGGASQAGTIELDPVNGYGYYIASFTPIIAVQYYAYASYNGTGFNLYFSVIAGPISVANSGFTDDNTGQKTAIAGTAAFISAQARDQYNNPQTTLANFSIWITGGPSPDQFIEFPVPSLSHPLLGESVFNYTIDLIGEYTVTLYFGSQNVTSSALTVHTGQAAYSASSLSGPHYIMINDVADYLVKLVDAFGNPSEGADAVSAQFTGTNFASVVTPHVTYTTGGKYVFSFNGTIGGLYDVSVSVNNVFVLNTTIGVKVYFGGQCSTFTSSINQGQTWTLTCNAWNEYGQSVAVGGASIETMTPSGAAPVTDLGNGAYELAYSSQDLGTHLVNVSINGLWCVDMPLSVTVTPGPVLIGTIIPAVVIFCLIVLAIALYIRKQMRTHERLLAHKRKPLQVFRNTGEEGEWDEGGSLNNSIELKEWNTGPAEDDDAHHRLQVAHHLALSSVRATSSWSLSSKA